MNWLIEPTYGNHLSEDQPLHCGWALAAIAGGAFLLIKVCHGEGSLCSDFNLIDVNNC